MSWRVPYIATSDVYCRYVTVPEALNHTFGELVRAKIQEDPINWLECYEGVKQFSFLPSDKHRVDQDLRTCTVSILRALYELGPIQCNLSQVLEFIASSTADLKQNRMYAGFNDRGLCDMTSETMYQQYMNVGYKGIGQETINHVCLFTDAELTALFTLENFDSEVSLPEAYSKAQLYSTLRTILEDKEKCKLFLEKWKKFQPHFARIFDADDKLGKRGKIFSPFTGQNRVHSSGRVATADPTRFFAMERWTMFFWSSMPRTATKYLSEEGQNRDGCGQTILDCEMLHKAADCRNTLIVWDSPHVRWARLPESEQTR